MPVYMMSHKMEQAIENIVDAMCGEEPSLLEQSRPAEGRRTRRIEFRTVLNRLVMVARKEARQEQALHAQQVVAAIEQSKTKNTH